MEKTDKVFVWCEGIPDKKMGRFTKGEDYAVTGGTEIQHKMLVDFTETFAKKIRGNFPKNEAELNATTSEIMEQVFGKECRKKKK